ncbi:MAG: anoctamin [bacterium]
MNAAVGVINFAFKELTIYFVKNFENHKYKQDHDKSLMTKLASFKFINIHLPIVYALIDRKLRPP